MIHKFIAALSETYLVKKKKKNSKKILKFLPDFNSISTLCTEYLPTFFLKYYWSQDHNICSTTTE